MDFKLQLHATNYSRQFAVCKATALLARCSQQMSIA